MPYKQISKIAVMKYSLIFVCLIGMIILPAQSALANPTEERCSNFCIKVNVNTGSGFRKESNNLSSDLNSSNNMQWQASINIIWQSDSPETKQAEAQRAKQQLEDDKTLMTDLSEAISQNKMVRANSLAILLAKRLGYTDPKRLIADIQANTISLSKSPTKIPEASL
jgi:hypothetical protein